MTNEYTLNTFCFFYFRFHFHTFYLMQIFSSIAIFASQKFTYIHRKVLNHTLTADSLIETKNLINRWLHLIMMEQKILIETIIDGNELPVKEIPIIHTVRISLRNFRKKNRGQFIWCGQAIHKWLAIKYNKNKWRLLETRHRCVTHMCCVFVHKFCCLARPQLATDDDSQRPTHTMLELLRSNQNDFWKKSKVQITWISVVITLINYQVHSYDFRW